MTNIELGDLLWTQSFICLTGLAQNWYGGSSVSWIHQHVVQHHIHTNDVFLDPDIEGKSPILRLNPNQPLLKAYAFQHVHYFFLILVFGYNIIYQAVTTVLEFANKAPFSALLRPYILGEHLWNAFFVIRWFLLPMVLAPSFWTPLTIMPMFMVFGTYLSFFFHISHNFEGVEQLEDTSSKNSFLYNQASYNSKVAWVSHASSEFQKWSPKIYGNILHSLAHHFVQCLWGEVMLPQWRSQLPNWAPSFPKNAS